MNNQPNNIRVFVELFIDNLIFLNCFPFTIIDTLDVLVNRDVTPTYIQKFLVMLNLVSLLNLILFFVLFNGHDPFMMKNLLNHWLIPNSIYSFGTAVYYSCFVVDNENTIRALYLD